MECGNCALWDFAGLCPAGEEYGRENCGVRRPRECRAFGPRKSGRVGGSATFRLLLLPVGAFAPGTLMGAFGIGRLRVTTMDAEVPLYESVAKHIRRLVEGGTFRVGDRVPSVRSLSAKLDVSVTTVLGAYRLL